MNDDPFVPLQQSVTPPLRPNSSHLVAPLNFQEAPKHLSEELAEEKARNLAGIALDIRVYLKEFPEMTPEQLIELIWARRGADLGINRTIIAEAVQRAVALLAKKRHTA